MIKINAIDIQPGDWIDNRKVVAAIPNYLRKGQTEIRFSDGEIEFLRNEKLVEIHRPSRRPKRLTIA